MPLKKRFYGPLNFLRTSRFICTNFEGKHFMQPWAMFRPAQYISLLLKLQLVLSSFTANFLARSTAPSSKTHRTHRTRVTFFAGAYSLLLTLEPLLRSEPRAISSFWSGGTCLRHLWATYLLCPVRWCHCHDVLLHVSLIGFRAAVRYCDKWPHMRKRLHTPPLNSLLPRCSFDTCLQFISTCLKTFGYKAVHAFVELR